MINFQKIGMQTLVDVHHNKSIETFPQGKKGTQARHTRILVFQKFGNNLIQNFD